MRICVTCNSGYKGEETPCAFHLGGRRLPVVTILGRWLDTPHKYFEVTVEDGRRFVLRQDVMLRTWELSAVFAAAKPGPKAPAQVPPRKPAEDMPQPWWRFGR